MGRLSPRVYRGLAIKPANYEVLDKIKQAGSDVKFNDQTLVTDSHITTLQSGAYVHQFVKADFSPTTNTLVISAATHGRGANIQVDVMELPDNETMYKPEHFSWGFDAVGNITIDAAKSLFAKPFNGKLIVSYGAALPVNPYFAGCAQIKTEVQRDAMTTGLGKGDAHQIAVYNTDRNRIEVWDGDIWLGAGDIKAKGLAEFDVGNLVSLGFTGEYDTVLKVPSIAPASSFNPRYATGIISCKNGQFSAIQREGISFAIVGTNVVAGYFGRGLTGTNAGKLLAENSTRATTAVQFIEPGITGNKVKCVLKPFAEVY